MTEEGLARPRAGYYHAATLSNALPRADLGGLAACGGGGQAGVNCPDGQGWGSPFTAAPRLQDLRVPSGKWQGPFEPQAESNFYGLVFIRWHSTIKSRPINQAGPRPPGHVCTNSGDKTSIFLINSRDRLRDSGGKEVYCLGAGTVRPPGTRYCAEPHGRRCVPSHAVAAARETSPLCASGPSSGKQRRSKYPPGGFGTIDLLPGTHLN